MPEIGLSRQRQGQLGVNAVERVVLGDWKSRWQPLDAVNDDGVDGLIFIERGGNPTGQIVHVQVKCRSEVEINGRFALPLSSKKLERNAARWRRIVGAAILVKVNPTTLDAHWVDLRSAGATGRSQIFVPVSNVFDAGAKNPIAKLCGTLHGDLLLPQIKVTADNFSYLRTSAHPKVGAREIYRKLNEAGLRFPGSTTDIRFTREGWRHINRSSREPMARVQSWNLLNVIPRLIGAVPENRLQVVRPMRGNLPELVSASAMILFPFRQAAIVQVLFRRRGCEQTRNYSFHTIYEPRRKRNLAGL